MGVKSVGCTISMKQFFFDCHHAKIIWRIIQLNSYWVNASLVHTSYARVLVNRYWQIMNEKLIFVVVAVLFWSIWCTRNDFVFHKKRITSFIQANELLLLYRLPSGKHTDSGFGHYCSIMMRRPDWRVKQSRLLLVWTFLLRNRCNRNRLRFACNCFILFCSHYLFQLISWKFDKNFAVCGRRGRKLFSFAKKKL
jgi:hypothetical protein